MPDPRPADTTPPDSWMGLLAVAVIAGLGLLAVFDPSLQPKQADATSAVVEAVTDVGAVDNLENASVSGKPVVLPLYVNETGAHQSDETKPANPPEPIVTGLFGP
ncbi:MAG: hypothetical protein AAGH99_14175 [Planctomycetota bacterium]